MIRIAAFALLLGVAWGQETPKKEEPKKDEPKAEAKKDEPKKPVYVALVGGDVVTVTKGTLKGATVLFKDDKIHRIGHGIPLPERTTQFDVKGKRVLPGYVAAQARGLGLSGWGGGKISDSLDPYAETVKLALASGITTAYLEFGFGGGFWGGRVGTMGQSNAVVKMSYGRLAEMTVLEPAAVNLSNWTHSPASQKHEIRERFMKARDFILKTRDYEKRKAENRLQPNEQPPQNPGVDNEVKLLRREIAARIDASTADDIRSALQLLEDFPFACVLVNVDEGWTMPDEISRVGATCLITPRNRVYADRNVNRPNGSSIEQAAILRRAGVKFAVVPLAPSIDLDGIAGRDLLTLPIETAFAIRGGLDERTALESITITAAEMIGVSHRVGSIEEGKDADVIVLDGDPFDYRTFVEKTFVNGRLLYDKDKSPYFSHIRRK
ncbi:MAG: amidohydrolase family protein [Planctomycetes bacterium]|nr:amidohydrolase family protein [Planctomycetota bacterium]